MYTPTCSVQHRVGFGCQNAAMHPVSKAPYTKRMCAGSLSTHMDCYLESRARADRFTRPVIHRRGRRHLHATLTQAGKSGVHTKAIRETLRIGNFTAMSVSTCGQSTWDQSPAKPERWEERRGGNECRGW